MSRRRATGPRCGKHPLDMLSLVEVDCGGCPEEGTPFRTEPAVRCSKCQHEVERGTLACLAFLLLKAQGAEKQVKALKARIGRQGQTIRRLEERRGCACGPAQ